MKIKYAVILATSAITLVALISVYSQNYYLPISKWGKGNSFGAQIGKDGFSCKKIGLTYEQGLVAIKKLELSKVNLENSHNLFSTANCHVSWWDISFPLEAQYFLATNNNQVLKMAAWKNGYLYITDEER